ncbi:class I SAM-dependent methyltransferase [Streptomyces zingiberis]|uniref:Methyltransferase domain-containing protein n=1 Tax=Streptomyces zingiberis TaxID=2053010 RepID=A0ABX1C898_9ACTN|nr:class I SAM-dependent methyltransferase [Streptomyces zingiberis]NJQ03169.1 methyltransferase domain-containing protein [Streptomyces zingiberis]
MRDPSAPEVGEWYDRFGGLYGLTMGDSMHMGMWADGVRTETEVATAEEMWEELTRAQDSWTSTLINVVGLLPGQHMVDIGCGTGRPTVRIGTESGANVLGVTVSAAQVEAGRDRAVKAGVADRVTFEQADAMALPQESGSFDAAWAIESFAHFSDRPAAIREVRRVLRPGGRFVLADCYEAVPFTPEEVQLFQAAFALSRLPAGPGDYSRMLGEAGFTIRGTRDMSREFKPTYELIPRLFTARRTQIAQLVGTDAMAQLDTVYPRILTLCRDKMGYTMVNAVKTP